MNFSSIFIKFYPTMLVTGTAGIATSGIQDISVNLGLDWVMIFSVVVGLLFGILWRAGNMTSSDIQWSVIKKDILVSVMISGVNLLLSLTIIFLIDIEPNPLYYMSIGAVVATMGTSFITVIQEAVSSYLKNKFK